MSRSRDAATSEPGERVLTPEPGEQALAPEPGERVLTPATLDTLIGALIDRGYTVLGPTLRNGVVVYDELHSAASLPVGVGDDQGPGRYGLIFRGDDTLFDYAVGPSSPKRWLLPPHSTVFTAARRNGEIELVPADQTERRYAILGIRACELAAIAVQDRVFLRDSVRDVLYATRRETLLTVAVQCAQPAATCFCESTGTGPEVVDGFDVRLTELTGDDHRFLAAAGSDVGQELLDQLPSRPATEADRTAAAQVVTRAREQMGRAIDMDGLKDLLHGNLSHPRYRDIAKRCLACGNCTMVCPTCFCTGLVDTNDLSGEGASRQRMWDSCFTLGYSYIHGGPVRSSVSSRYRQWLTHKFASWWDQFGTSGCVGCGRCITWCPVGIDVTEELSAIRRDDRRQEVP